MKRNKIFSFAMRCLSATLLFLFLLSEEGYTQQVDFCGEFHKTSNPVPTDSIYYMDRFGNYYTVAELALLSATPPDVSSLVVNHCFPNANNFILRFDPLFYPPNADPNDQSSLEQHTIECAFLYLSRFFTLRNPAIRPTIFITKTSPPDVTLEDQTAAVGSALYRAKTCGVNNGEVWEIINGGGNGANLANGLIIFNSNLDGQWEFFTALNQTITPTNADLFTITVHEALHCLGFASFIPANPTVVPANSEYTRWDNLLYNRSRAQFVLRPRTGNTCECPKFGIPTNIMINNVSVPYDYSRDLLTGCANSNIVIGCNGTTSINTTAPTNITGSPRNTIAHLCDAPFRPIMQPSTNRGERREMTNEELDILCELGYITTRCPQNPPPQNDTELAIISRGLAAPSDIITVSRAEILDANNITDGPDVTVTVSRNGTPLNITDINGTGTMFRIAPTTNGPYQQACGRLPIRYTISISTPRLCDNTRIDCNHRIGELIIFRPCQAITPCVMDNCNMVCNGNIDGLLSTTNQSYWDLQDRIIRSNFDIINIPLFGKVNRRDYFSTVPASIAPSTVCNATYPVPAKPGATANDQILDFDYIVGRPLPAYFFRLKKPMVATHRYRLRFRKFSACTGILNFAFSANPPCQRMGAPSNPAAPLPTMSFLLGQSLTTDCAFGTYKRVQHNYTPSPLNPASWDNNLTEITIPADAINAPANQTHGNAGHLIVYMNDTPPLMGTKRSIYLDDFELEDLEDARVEITPTVIRQCSGGNVVIQYTIRNLNTGGLPGTFSLRPTLAANSGLTLAGNVNMMINGVLFTNQFFNNQIANVTIYSGEILTRTLILEVAPNLQGQVRNIPLVFIPGITQNTCLITNTPASTVLDPGTPVVPSFTFVQPICPNPTLSATTLSNTTGTWELFLNGANQSFAAGVGSSFNTNNITQGSVYQLQYTVSNTCGQRTGANTIIVPSCTVPPTCACSSDPSNPPINIVNFANPNTGEVLLSSVTQLPGSQKSNGCVTIRGTLVIDKPFGFVGTTIIMQPGSRIRTELSGNPSRFELLGCTISSGTACQQRWLGIDIGINTNINIQNNQIRDAEAALTLRGGVAGTIANNDIFNDYVGIDAIGTPANPTINCLIKGNRIQGSSTLLPAFISANNSPLSFIGIRMQDASLLLGVSGSLAAQNNISIFRRGISMEGSMISAFETSINSSIGSSIDRDMDPSPNPLIIEHTGIYGVWSQMNLNGLSMNSLGQAIRLWSSFGFSFNSGQIINADGDIYNTTSLGGFKVGYDVGMKTSFSGIWNYECSNYDLEIYPNSTIWYGTNYRPKPFFSFGHMIKTDAFTTGISGFKKINITGTHATRLSTDFMGLEMMNDGRYKVDGLKFYYTEDTNKDAIGFSISGSKNNRFTKCEVFSGINNSLTRTAKGKAFDVTGGQNNAFCCSRVNNIISGLEFKGNCDFSSLRTTDFRNTINRGLWLRNTTVNGTVTAARIGTQPNAFNTWVTGPTVYTVAAATHDAGLIAIMTNDVINSQFTCGTNLMPPSIVGNGAGWFATQGGSNSKPSDCLTGCPNNTGFLLPPSSSNDREVEIPASILRYATASQNTSANEYHQWHGGSEAMNAIMEHDEWIGINPLFDTYYVRTFNSNIRRFNDVNKLLATLNAPDTNQKAAIESLDGQINTANTQLISIDAALENSILTEAERSAKMLERKTLLTTCYQAFTTKRSIATEIKLKNVTLIDDANLINESIRVENIFEQNEQKVNRIYLRSLAKDIFTLSNTDEQEVRNIANQCPMIAGHAVFKARVLHTLFEPRQFNDNIICNSTVETPSGKIAISKTPDGNEVKVFPNPASDILNIQLKNPSKATIILRGINGNILQTIETSEDTRIDISDLPNGIILSEVWVKGQRIDTKKIIIIH